MEISQGSFARPCSTFPDMENETAGLPDYPSKIAGAAFTAEIGFRRIKFWLADQDRRRLVNVSNLQSVVVEPNGYTKLVLRLQKDVVIPTTSTEALGLVKALNPLLSERRAADQRDREAGREARRKQDFEKNRPRPGARVHTAPIIRK